MPEIGPLFRHHDRVGFDCGVQALNGFLKSTARQHGDKGISRTFVLTGPENPSIIQGYFTLTLCEVKTEHLPVSYARKFPEHGLPAVRLARLAVDTRFQGCGYGGYLLAEAIHRTVLIAEYAGVIGLFVDAKDEPASLFYQRYGFKPLPNNVQKLFLPIETLRKVSLR